MSPHKAGHPGAGTPDGPREDPELPSTKTALGRSVAELSQTVKHRTGDGAQNGINPLHVHTLPEAAEALRVGERRVRELVAHGDLRRMPYTRSFLLFGEDIIAFLRGAS